MTAPALVGLVIGNTAFVWVLRRLSVRRHGRAEPWAARPVLSLTRSS
jgi:hypothetical protein